MKRKHIIILAVVALVDLAFFLWHYSRPTHHPPTPVAPVVPFHATFPRPDPSLAPTASRASSSAGSHLE